MDAGKRELRDFVAREVLAQLGRRRLSVAEMAKQLGWSQSYLQRRVDGRVAFDVDDLETVTEALGIHLAELLPKSALSRDYAVTPERTVRKRIVRSTDPRPIDRGPRSPSAVRPISALPVTKRRPGPVRPMARAS